jgi:triphosphoribosyl-dephospho-CoA synthetase
MIEWVMGVVDRIEEEARRDPEYREFMEHQVELVPAFDALLQRISEDDRELILEYMETAMNRQYRFSQLAWRYGRRNP